MLKQAGIVASIAVLVGMGSAEALGKRAYGDHQALLLSLLKLRIAVKPLAAAVPAAASPVAIVEIAIEGVRRFLCAGYPLQPIEVAFPDVSVLTAESAHCNSLWQPE